MAFLIEAIGAGRLAEYASVPTVCEVRSRIDVGNIGDGSGGLTLAERAVENPYVKDYDSYVGGPCEWAKRFDLSRWGLWIARDGADVVGGAAVVWGDPAVEMAENQREMAVLWDIRVRPTNRRRGVGTALFREAAIWASRKGCRVLQIETQDVNVAACRFYMGMGCILARIDRLAYRGCAAVAGEIMLIFNLAL